MNKREPTWEEQVEEYELEECRAGSTAYLKTIDAKGNAIVIVNADAPDEIPQQFDRAGVSFGGAVGSGGGDYYVECAPREFDVVYAIAYGCGSGVVPTILRGRIDC